MRRPLQGTKTMTFRSLTAAAVLLLLSAPAPASERHPGLVASSLTAAERTRLELAVAQARDHHAAIFARVGDLAGLRPEIWRQRRERRPTVGRELRALGPDALLPMLEMMAFTGYPRSLSTNERLALEAGLLDAVAELRDARAEPILRAAFRAASERHVLLGAARGLGALGGDGNLTLLVEASHKLGIRREAAIEGLGACHSLVAAERLAAILEEEDVASARRAVKALGAAGSSWAWATGQFGDAREGERLRNFAAARLAQACLARAELPVTEIVEALGMLEAPDTRAELEHVRARASDGRSRERIDRLMASWQRRARPGK